MNWLGTTIWIVLALFGLTIFVIFLDEIRGRRLFVASRLTSALLWYFTLSWPFVEPDFNRVHWLWLLPMTFWVSTLVQRICRSLAVLATNATDWAFFGFIAGPFRNPPQFWFFTILGSLLAYYFTLHGLSAHPFRSALCLVGGSLSAVIGIRLFDKLVIKLPDHTKSALSIIRSRLSWMDHVRFGGAGDAIAAELKPNERVLAVAKGPHSFRTMNSRPEERGPGLLIVTTLRIFVSGVRSSERLEIPIENVIALQDLCPTDSPSEPHTVEVMALIDCVDGTSLSGRDCLTISFAVSFEAAREVDAAARTFWKDDEVPSAE